MNILSWKDNGKSLHTPRMSPTESRPYFVAFFPYFLLFRLEFLSYVGFVKEWTLKRYSDRNWKSTKRPCVCNFKKGKSYNDTKNYMSRITKHALSRASKLEDGFTRTKKGCVQTDPVFGPSPHFAQVPTIYILQLLLRMQASRLSMYPVGEVTGGPAICRLLAGYPCSLPGFERTQFVTGWGCGNRSTFLHGEHVQLSSHRFILDQWKACGLSLCTYHSYEASRGAEADSNCRIGEGVIDELDACP